jgi:hypothetical protein
MAAAKPTAMTPDPYSRPRANIVAAAAADELVVTLEEDELVGAVPLPDVVVALLVVEAAAEVVVLEGDAASATGANWPQFCASAVLQSA